MHTQVRSKPEYRCYADETSTNPPHKLPQVPCGAPVPDAPRKPA